MSIHKSTGVIAGGLAPKPLNAIKCGGRVRLHICKYVGKGTEAADDKIELMVQKKNQKIVPHLSYVTGDLADDTIKASVDDLTGQVALNAYASLGSVASNLDEEISTEEKTLYATVTGAIPVGKTVVFAIAYTQL